MRFNFDDAERDGLLFCVLSKRYGLFFEEKGSRWICEVDPSLNVFASPKTGNLLVKDFGNRYPQFARAKGLQAVLTDLYGQDLQAKINDLAGCDYAPAQEWVDRENARNSSGNTAAQSAVLCCPTAAVSDSPKYDGALSFDGSRTYGQDKKKEKSAPEKPERQHVITSWDSAQGQNVLRFFEEKAGIKDGAADFLTQYGIAPLHSTGAYTFPANGQNSGFIIRQSGWEKVRQTAPKDKQFKWQQYPAKDGAPYLFGFNALPLSGENLYFLEGETDAAAFAYHTGAPVLSLGSTSNFDALPESVAAELKARFPNIFVLWDADSAGAAGGQKFADKHGFTFVDTAVLFQQTSNYIGQKSATATDICAFYSADKYGAERLQYLEKIAPLTNGRILSYADDIYSVPVTHILQLPFNQYLSAEGKKINLWGSESTFVHPVPFVLSALSVHGKISLISAAGTGKSVMLSELAKLHKAENIIIAVPTITLAEQLQKTLNRAINGGAGLVFGAMGEHELQGARAHRVIVSTFDGLLKIRGLVPTALLVIDEYHQLASEHSYRKKAVRLVLRAAARKGQNLLMLSATPDYILSEFLDAKVMLCSPETTNKITLRCVKTSVKRNQLAALIAEKEGASIAAGHTVGIKLDSVNTLHAFKEYLETLTYICAKTGEKKRCTAEIFTSKDSGLKENPNYKSILETGYFAEEKAPNFLLFTTILEAGVSIKSPMPSIYILDKADAAKVIQIATRPRYVVENGTNAHVTVTVLFSAKEKKKENSTETAKQLFTRIYTAAQALAVEFTAAQKLPKVGKECYKTEKCPEDFVYCANADLGSWRADAAGVLDYIRQKANKGQNAELLCKRITRLDKRFTPQIVSWADYQNELATEIADKNAREKERISAEFTRLILGANSKETLRMLVLIAARKLKKDKEKQGALLSAFGFFLPQDIKGKDELRAEIAEFAKANPIVFSGFCPLIGTVNKAAFYCDKGEKLEAAFKKAAEIGRKDFLRKKSQAQILLAQKAKNAGTANPQQLKLCAFWNDICAKIGQKNRNLARKNAAPFTAESIQELVDGVLKEHGYTPTKSKTDAIERVYIFFDIEKSDVSIKDKTAAKGAKKKQKTVQIYTLSRCVIA